MNCITRSRWIVPALIAAALLVALGPGAEAAQAQGKKLPTSSELTAQWWRWVYSIPVSENPLFDETGEFAANQQPYKKVFFLVGVINESGTAERSITVPEGTPFFFPLINVEWDNVGVAKKDRLTVPELYDVAEAVVDSATDLHITLNGESLADDVKRIVSHPFAYQLPKKDNILQFFGFDIDGPVAPAVSDGYWMYLPPLPKGTHELRFGGTFPDFDFTVDITYHITVK